MKNKLRVHLFVVFAAICGYPLHSQTLAEIPEDLSFTAIAPRSDRCVVAVGDSSSSFGTYFVEACLDSYKITRAEMEGYVRKIVFPEPEAGWMLVSHTLVKYNAGQMTRVDMPGIENDFDDLSFANPKQGCAVSSEGRLVCTSNRGRTWTEQILGRDIDLTAVAFADRDVGWIIGSDRASTAGLLANKPVTHFFRTVNGGQSWKRESTPMVNEPIVDIRFRGPVGWAITRHRGIFVTMDRGVNWKKVAPNDAGWVEDASFIDDVTGYILTDKLWRTVNFGRSWLAPLPIPKGNPAEYKAVVFLNGQYGWMISHYQLAQTSDGGQTWVELFRN